jgi:hypothetical protein
MPSKDLVREVTLLDHELSAKLIAKAKHEDLGKSTIIRRALRYFLDPRNNEAFHHFISRAHDITD